MQISCASVSVTDAKEAKYACKSRAAAFELDASERGLLKLAWKSSCILNRFARYANYPMFPTIVDALAYSQN